MPKGVKGFQKGQVANPGGRPKAIGETRKLLTEILVDKSGTLINKAVEMAENGNEGMVKFLLDRIIPKQIEGFKNFNAQADAKTIINNAMQQYADNEISSDALNDATRAVQARINAVELLEMKSKIDALWDAKQKREGLVP